MPRRRPEPEPSRPEQAEPASSRTAPSSDAWSPRDILIPYVLLAVSMQRAHGYLIEEYLRSVGFFGLEMSTLYRTLRQLEKNGLLNSTWEAGPAGPARRVYALTDIGRTWLDQWAGTLDTYRRMLDQFFGLYGQRKDSKGDDST
jgi:PadR family transcriptional regulator PadR